MESNRTKLERFFAAAMSGDYETQAALMHPDVEVHEADGLPYAGVYRGIAGWRRLHETIFETWTDIEAGPQYVIGEENGDRFAAMMFNRGRYAPTGAKYDTTVFEMWRFQDGLIIEVRPYYWDTKLMADLMVRDLPSA